MSTAAQQSLFVLLGLLGFSATGVGLVIMVDTRLPFALRYAFVLLFASGLLLGLGSCAMMVLWGLVDMGWLKP